MLVSANFNGTGGGNGHSAFGQISANGRYVVFQSDASDLVPGDTNGVSDIFLRDVLTGTTRLISVATDGGPGNGASYNPVMTPDGSCVAFISKANNLVAGDANGMVDMFVRDLFTQTTWIVSVGAVPPSGSTDGNMATPRITPDGRFVAFFSDAQGLVSAVPGTSQGEIYLRDRMVGTTTWASVSAGIIVSNSLGLSTAVSYRPRISDDGRYVAFKAGSTNSGEAVVILQYDSVMSGTAVVSTNGIAAYTDEDDLFGPEMTPSGSFIAFVQGEGAGTNPPYSSVHVWNALTTADALVSDSGSGVPPNTYSRSPAISPDGQSVAFLSNATNLVANEVSDGYHIYLRNLTSNVTILVDADTNGAGTTDDQLAAFGLSADGRFVVFSSPDGNLVSLDSNRALDIFLRDVVVGATALASKRNSTVISQTGDAASSVTELGVSADGRWVVFSSLADDLVPGDTNRLADVFAQDLLTGARVLVSAGLDGNPALGGPSGSPVISEDSRYVAFASSATNLVAGLVGSTNNIYRRDLLTGTTVLVSISPSGVGGGSADSTDPVISADGRYVAFQSQAVNLTTNVTSVAAPYTFWRDMNQAFSLLVGRSGKDFPPSMSHDGRYLAYFGIPAPPEYSLISRWQLYVRDLQLGLNVYSNIPPSTIVNTSAALSPDGKHLLYANSANWGISFLLLDDVMTGQHLLSITNTHPIRNTARWSADGRYVAFVATTNSAGVDDGTNRLFLYDVVSNSITLVNPDVGPNGSAGAVLDSPALSGDGRFVAYRAAVNSFSWVTNPPPNIFVYDRLTGSNLVLTASQAGSDPVVWASRPAISGSGQTVVFSSLGSGLVSGDLNRAPDVFAEFLDIGTALDTDSDGIPDWWLAEFFGHATGQVGDLSRPQDDADGDGMSNWQEWIAGTDPTDPLSRLKMLNPSWSVSGLTLSWQSAEGVVYYIQRSTLHGQVPFTSIQSNIVGQAGITTYTDTNAAGPGPLFYRVGVQ